MLSFLVIIECILIDLPHLDFLCKDVRLQIKDLQQDQDFKDKIKSLKQTHSYFFTASPQTFDQIETDKIEKETQTVFRKIKQLASLALQGSTLFGKTLEHYLLHVSELVGAFNQKDLIEK